MKKQFMKLHMTTMDDLRKCIKNMILKLIMAYYRASKRNGMKKLRKCYLH